MDIRTTSRQTAQYDRTVHKSLTDSSAVRSTKNVTNMLARPWFCFIILVLYFMILSSSASPIKQQEITKILKKPLFVYTKRVRIYSRNSGGHLRVVGHQIDYKGKQSEPSAVMVLESVNYKGHIRIKSERENSYLCISGNDGKLVLEPKANDYSRCLFVEDYHQGYTMFKSVFNAKWFLASKRSGHIKQPCKTNRTQTAVLFLVEMLS